MHPGIMVQQCSHSTALISRLTRAASPPLISSSFKAHSVLPRFYLKPSRSSLSYSATSTFSSSTLAQMSHKLCMIPGPVEFDSHVLEAMATPATSHVDPSFVNAFGNAIELTRKIFMAPTGQPFIVAGSGTLTWDMTAANLIEPGDKALVVNTGIFGDWFAECLEVYGAQVKQLTVPFGDRPSIAAITAALKDDHYKLVTVTHVDTSSGVLTDIKAIAQAVRAVSPHTLIALDGVCSVAAEEIRMDEWGRSDVVMTASQKAIGVPPGLALMVVSQRALATFKARKAKPTTYFGSFAKWLPIMQKYEARQPSYFATPPVQLILALEASLQQLASRGMETRFQKHIEASNKVKAAVERLNLKLVPIHREYANTLSAVYYPDGVSGADFLKVFTANGIVVAGGLHPQHNTKYFRIGHMNVSATEPENGHLDKVIAALEMAVHSTQTAAKI
ncbi:hypothetical protein BSLG_004425 [Batrachochytrium salamandrivorans]|nr:hypothetical protein BSLG_004425 [Batrachochytrium salamandrivorans]